MSNALQDGRGASSPRIGVRRPALRIALIYAVVAGLWVGASDWVLPFLVRRPMVLTAVAILKGWIFVAVTAALLYVLVERSLRPLRESEEEYRGIFEGNPSVFLKIDAEGNIVSVNPPGAQQLGYAPEELVGRSVLHVYSEPDRRKAIENIDSLARGTGGAIHWEARAVRKDGSFFWLGQSARAFTAGGGRPSFLLVGEDITDRKRAEDALGSANESLRALVHASPLGIIGVDREGRVLAWSKAAERILGWTEREVLGHPNPAVPETRRGEYLELRGRVLRGESIDHADTERLRKDGSTIPVRLWAGPIRDPHGRILGSLAMMSDMSEQKERESELRRLNRALRVLTECNELLLRAPGETELLRDLCRLLVDVGGYRLAWVAHAEHDEARSVLPLAQAGYERGYLEAVRITWADTELGRGPTGTCIRTARPCIARNILTDPAFAPWREEAIRRGYASSIALPLCSDGEVMGALNLYSAEPDAFDEEEVKLLVQLADDLAYGIAVEHSREERRRAEEERNRAEEALRLHAAELERRVEDRTAQLTEINAELESFTYSVSHDLRAPLRAMQGFAQALLEDYGNGLDETAREYSSRIVAASERMDELIRDLLAYSRLGREELRLKPVSLASTVTEVMDHLDPELRAKSAQVAVQGSLPDVLAHRATLGRVVSNLVTNAVKFVGKGVEPKVRVRAEEHRGRVRLWIEDNGIGIARENHARIFGVFERLHGVETFPGAGIGLAIVRKGMERMGGDAGVESEPGKGSRFWIELDAAGSSR